MISLKNIQGKKYHFLTVMSEATKRQQPNGTRVRHFDCLCDCGNLVVVAIGNLRSGHTKSCGCHKIKMLSDRMSTHRLTNHPLHKLWLDMIKRCYQKSCKSHKDYGGRGIEMCEEWRGDFINFYNWAKSRCEDGMQIDRINNDGNYTPSNCRFVSQKQNARNKRNNVFTEAKVGLVRHLHIYFGHGNNELARMFNTSPSLMSQVLNNKIWVQNV